MTNDLVCSECGGSKAVAHRRKFVEIGNGLTEMHLTLESPDDLKRMNQVAPELMPAGHTWGYRRELNGKGQVVVIIGPRKVEDGTPAATDELPGKTNAELSEVAVTLGITDADPKWTKAKLIDAIRKAREAKK